MIPASEVNREFEEGEAHRYAGRHDWAKDYGNVLELARWLDADGDFGTSTKAVIRFFEKPWKWRLEFLAMRGGYPSFAAYQEAPDDEDAPEWTYEDIIRREA